MLEKAPLQENYLYFFNALKVIMEIKKKTYRFTYDDENFSSKALFIAPFLLLEEILSSFIEFLPKNVYKLHKKFIKIIRTIKYCVKYKIKE